MIQYVLVIWNNKNNYIAVIEPLSQLLKLLFVSLKIYFP